MALKTYSGSCHCGAVKFQAKGDLSQGTVKCNCSSCTKARSWLVFASPENFRLLVGDDAQATYRWTPPGQAAPNFHYYFCQTCGIRTPAQGTAEALGGAFHAIQVTLLNDVDADELAAAPIRYVDGKNDHFDSSPLDTRLL